MAFIITGDTHGTIDIGKVIKYFDGREDEYTKEDYLIICGDVGVCGFLASEEAQARNIFRNLPVTVLFVDGNHENFEHLNSYPVDEWNGGKVHFIESDIIHLMRGQVFCIDGVKFFAFGGAHSIDKMYRTPGLSWFPEEIPSREEFEEGWNNLEVEGFQVDYILTHTGPREVVAAMGYGDALSEGEIAIRQYFQRVAENTDFRAWYFGHFHEDTEVENAFFCLYDEMVEVKGHPD
ncbi:MAG: metallophosphoesterase [Lachnospiraceae bacterium]|nr:metallophosphoesterase [Lachnospiraceae bacterium]